MKQLLHLQHSNTLCFSTQALHKFPPHLFYLLHEQNQKHRVTKKKKRLKKARRQSTLPLPNTQLALKTKIFCCCKQMLLLLFFFFLLLLCFPLLLRFLSRSRSELNVRRERERERDMDDTWMRERNTWMILGCKREREREREGRSKAKPEARNRFTGNG